MLSIRTAIRESHATFTSIEVTFNDHTSGSSDSGYAAEQFFVVHLDRITDDATVYHQGRTIRTKHKLALDCTASDAQAFAICAVLSKAFDLTPQ